MKTVTALLPTTCFVLAAAVAMSGNDGWGWLMFIGYLIWMAS